jgi:DNA-binding Lrp family transcriptional regulator
MAMAYVFINTELNAEDMVLKELERIPGICETNIVEGIYDIVVRVEKGNLVDLKILITSEIWGLNKVRLTETMICYTG